MADESGCGQRPECTGQRLARTLRRERRLFVLKYELDEKGRWFVLRILRRDTNRVGEYEVTVTSGLHATHKQKEQSGRKEKTKLHPVKAQGLGRRPEGTG